MDIQLNGDTLTIPPGTTVTALLAAQGLAGRRVAVEVKGVGNFQQLTDTLKNLGMEVVSSSAEYALITGWFPVARLTELAAVPQAVSATLDARISASIRFWTWTDANQIRFSADQFAWPSTSLRASPPSQDGLTSRSGSGR